MYEIQMGFIYMLTSPSGKVYIGQTTRSIEKRFKQHEYPYSCCTALKNAIQKYGWENFEKHWYECPDEDLNDHEELMIEVLGTLAPGGYNLKEGGGNGKLSEETRQKISKALTGRFFSDDHKQKMREANIGKTLSDETKQKISEAQIGKTLSDEHKQKLLQANIGRIHTDETKQKISKAHTGKTYTDEYKQKMSESHKGENNYWYGKTLTDEHKQKISEANKGKTVSDETKEKLSKARLGEKNHMYGKTHTNEIRGKISESLKGEKNPTSKKVYQYTLDGTFVESFASIGDAARILGKNEGSSICRCANGVIKSSHGFKWSYEKLHEDM